jgi:hypothetical protein
MMSFGSSRRPLLEGGGGCGIGEAVPLVRREFEGVTPVERSKSAPAKISAEATTRRSEEE